MGAVSPKLDHADIATSFGYVHLVGGSVINATNRVSRGLADMLDGGGGPMTDRARLPVYSPYEAYTLMIRA